MARKIKKTWSITSEDAAALESFAMIVSRMKDRGDPKVEALLGAARSAIFAEERRDMTFLDGAIHCVELVKIHREHDYKEPESVAMYLATAIERLAHLVAELRAVADACEPARQRARTPHGRAERVA